MTRVISTATAVPFEIIYFVLFGQIRILISIKLLINNPYSSVTGFLSYSHNITEGTDTGINIRTFLSITFHYLYYLPHPLDPFNGWT